VQDWTILIIFGVQHQKKLATNDYTFGHLTLTLLLHYLVKCRLLSLLFASGINVCHLHSHWRTFWAHAVIKSTYVTRATFW